MSAVAPILPCATTPEELMREVRALLATAHQHEVAGEIEDAEAAGAKAGNKLARALRMGQHQ